MLFCGRLGLNYSTGRACKKLSCGLSPADWYFKPCYPIHKLFVSIGPEKCQRGSGQLDNVVSNYNFFT